MLDWRTGRGRIAEELTTKSTELPEPCVHAKLLPEASPILRSSSPSSSASLFRIGAWISFTLSRREGEWWRFSAVSERGEVLLFFPPHAFLLEEGSCPPRHSPDTSPVVRRPVRRALEPLSCDAIAAVPFHSTL